MSRRDELRYCATLISWRRCVIRRCLRGHYGPAAFAGPVDLDRRSWGLRGAWRRSVWAARPSGSVCDQAPAPGIDAPAAVLDRSGLRRSPPSASHAMERGQPEGVGAHVAAVEAVIAGRSLRAAGHGQEYQQALVRPGRGPHEPCGVRGGSRGSRARLPTAKRVRAPFHARIDTPQRSAATYRSLGAACRRPAHGVGGVSL
jgi:hypothetical protein